MSFKKIFLFLIFSLFAFGEVLASTQVSAKVDKTYAEVKEEIVLTINVISDSMDIKSPIMPSLPNFNIYSSGHARNISIINGKRSANYVFNYILSPRFAGKSTIGSFEVEVGGQVYKTEPIEIEVARKLPGNTGASSGGLKTNLADKVKNANKGNNPATSNQDQNKKYPDFFMVSQTDKKEAYLNEQINLRIRFYHNRNIIGPIQYDRPKMEGFIFEEIKRDEGFETLGGTQYGYVEFDMALFGILPGKATIGSAQMEFTPSGGDMLDMFDAFFGNSAKPQIAKTKPIEVNIKPLPTQGKTGDFYGAVGSNFKIENKVDKKQIAVGETLILTTTISGVGNMRAVDTMPSLDLGPSFRVYDSTSSSSTNIRSGLIGGTKEFQTIIVPRTSGNFTIPPSVFQYFNPQKGIYEVIQSAPISLRVLPAEDSQEQLAVQDYSQTTPQGSKIEKISSDIYYLKNEQETAFTKVLTKIKEFGKYNYLLFALLILALLIYFIRKGEFEFLSNRKAYVKAKKKISKAKNLNDIAPALQEYLSAKQGQPLGITTIAQSAQNLKLDNATTHLLTSFWQELEMSKYAPADTLKNTIALNQSVQKALNLLKQIEKEAK